MFLCTWDELRQGEISEDDKKMSLDEAVKYLEMGVEKSRDKNLECFLYCLSWLYKVSPAYRTTRTLSALVYTISSLSTTNIEQLKQIVNVKSWMIDDCLKSGTHPKLVVEEIFNFSAMLNSSNEYCLRGVCKSTEAKVWDVYGSKALKTHCVVSVCEMKKEECSEKDRVWAYLEFLDLLNLDNETKNRYIEEINHKFPVSVKKKEQLNSQTSESETKKSEAVLINELNTAHGLESIIIRIELSQLYLDNSNYVSALPHITSTISTSLKHNYKSGYLRGLHQYTKILKNFENFKECLKVYEVLVEELCCGGMDGCGGEEGREVRIEYAECLVTVFLEGGGGDDRRVDGGDGSGKDLFELEVAADCLRDVLDGMDVNNPSEREREQLQSVYKLLIVVYEHLGMEAEVENVRELERKLKKLGKK
ncbi:hypothetical protein HK098_002188 [Nowakowskiella sp. JEL0407]|nr:hypothetical protein HK098_002188 [Nowakowskiella sp. JEL0407]